MLSLKIFTGAMRGASVLVSNQVGPVITNIQSCQQAPQHESEYTQAFKHFATASMSGGFLSQAAARTKTQSSIEPVDIPAKPKKPMTPWLAFVRDRKDDVLKQNDGKMSAAKLSVILAEEWKHADKTKYREVFDQQHDEYVRKIDEYEKSLTKKQRQYLELQKEVKRGDKANKLLRKTNPPVLPRNPANIYVQERSKQDDIKEQLKHRKLSEVFRDVFKEYRALSEDEKQKYIAMQEEDKSRFQHEFIAWYESIQNNETLTKTALEKADALRDRFKTLNYI